MLYLRYQQYSCFLSHPGAFWGSFLAPIIFILIFNFIIFIWIAVILILHARRTSARKMETMNYKSTGQLMISIGGVSALFGITWLFAILTFSLPGLREAFQILFTLFNSLQGFFIFLFFCAISKEARESWKELVFGSAQRSELINSPDDNTNSKMSLRVRKNGFRNQGSRTDTSTFKMNDQTVLKLEESRKDSLSSVTFACKSESHQFKNEMPTKEQELGNVDKKDKASDAGRMDELKHIMHSAIDFPLNTVADMFATEQVNSDNREEEDSIRKSFKDNSSLASNLFETASDNAKSSRKSSKDNSLLKVRLCRRYSSRNKGDYKDEMEFEVEEMAVEIYSESSSESSDEDIEQ